MPSKGLRCSILHPQSFTEDPGVTLLPHSHKHSAYRLFQVIRRIKTYPNPELLCSKSIYNFFSPPPGGKSGFQAGKPWREGMLPVQWPVASLLAFASWEGWDEFLETAASQPLGGVARSVLTLCAQLWRWWGSAARGNHHDRKIHTWNIKVLLSRSGDQRGWGEEGHLAHLKIWRPLPCFPERAVRNDYSITFFPPEKNIIKPNPHEGF